MIETTPITKVMAENQQGIDWEYIRSKFSDETIKSSTQAMQRLLSSKKTKRYFKDIGKAIDSSPWLETPFGLYFATVIQVKTLYGERALPYINQEYSEQWERPVELGSGVGCIEPWKGSQELLCAGINSPDLLVNYDSPGGRWPARWAGAMIVNSKINTEINNPLYGPQDVYITPSTTYALDIFMDALARQIASESAFKKRVVVLGPSYYALPFTAIDKGLPVTRLSRSAESKTTANVREFFPPPEALSAQIPEDTAAIIITLPNNPNGEAYDDNSFRKIVEIAKERNLIICLDLLFDRLWLPNTIQTPPPSPLKVAYEADALDNIVVVDGFSKSENLAGIRLAFLATKNKPLERIINEISISRLSNPDLTIEPYLQFEAMARYVEQRINLNTPPVGVQLAVELVRSDLGRLTKCPWLEDWRTYQLTDLFNQRRSWLDQSIQYYADNLRIIQTLLDRNGRKTWRSPDEAAYNTFVGFQDTPQNEGMDKIIKLFLLTGIVAMSGQCLGLKNPDNEFWTRITYGGLSRELLIQAMSRLCTFLDFWEEMDLGNENKYPVFNTSFNLI